MCDFNFPDATNIAKHKIKYIMKHLEIALGKGNQIWKYIIVLVVSFVAANIIGAIPLLIAIFVHSVQNGGNIMESGTDMSALISSGMSPNLIFLLMLIPFVVAFFVLIAMIKVFHKRSWKETINGTNKLRWKHFFWGAAFWFILSLASLGIQYFLTPEDFELQFNISAFIPLVIISLLFLPIQTGYEELAFRGYMAQGVGALTKNRWLVLIIPSVLFGLMHAANPEVKEFGFWIMIPQYIMMGALLGVVSILDDGIELAMGIHAANNIFASLFITHSSSAFQTPAIFMAKEVNPEGGLIEITIASILLIAFFYKKYNWKFSVMNKKIEREDIEGQSI